ncbi:alpha/beta fold hydrolase [Spongiibacter sp.]|uniref:alpha/beta fold hydrolase n=1 Tax=Spongiibacter sp. TaxID=2024860 RepID=UPI00356A1D00
MLEQFQGDFGRGDAVWQRGGSGAKRLHFAAANGFPVASYQFFLEHFSSDFQILGLENRGVWGGPPPSLRFNWQQHASDLIRFLETQPGQQPVIALGHSIGATVSALAAARRPDLFSALVMYDAASLPGRHLPAFKPLISPWLTGRMGLVRSTRSRRRQWSSHAEFIDYHRPKSAYRNFSEQAFQHYANAVLAKGAQGQYSLRYDPRWEAHNFRQVDSPWPALRRIALPTLMLRAEHSTMYQEHSYRWHARRCSPYVEHAILPAVGHMALQEDVELVVTTTREWLAGKGLL